MGKKRLQPDDDEVADSVDADGKVSEEDFFQSPILYPDWPIHVLPRSIFELSVRADECSGIQPIYVAQPALGHGAGCVNMRRRVRTMEGERAKPLTLWCGSIGRSGSNKSRGNDLSHELVVGLHTEEIERAEKARMLPTDICITDVNLASLKKVCRKSKYGTMVSPDEISPLLAMMLSKNVKVSDQTGQWCKLFDGTAIINRRILDGDANMDLVGVSVSIIGTIQPAIFFQITRGQMTDAGFVARMLLASPPPRMMTGERKGIPKKLIDALEADYRKLLALSGQRTLKLSKGAGRIFWDEWKPYVDGKAFYASNDALAASYSRKGEICARIAGLFHAFDSTEADDCSGPISEDEMRRAVEWCKRAVMEDEILFSACHESTDARQIRTIVQRVLQLPNREATFRDIQRWLHCSAQEMQQLAEKIVAFRRGEIITKDRSDSRALRIFESQKPAAPPDAPTVNKEVDEPEQPEPPPQHDDNSDGAPVGSAAGVEPPSDAELLSEIPDRPEYDFAPVDALDLTPEMRSALRERGLTMSGDIRALGRERAQIEAAITTMIPAWAGALAKRVTFALIVHYGGRSLRCSDCSREIGYDQAEGHARLCFECQAMASPETPPQTIPFEKPQPPAKSSRPKAKANP